MQSNEVSLLAAPAPSRAALSLLRTDPARGSALVASSTECRSTAGQTPLAPPLASNGTVLPLGEALPLSITSTVHGGEAVFLDVLDLDRNRDSTKIDHIDLTLTAAGGDTETVVLEETAVDSGRFVGYVQTRATAATPGDCVLQVQRDSELAASYTDPQNAADTRRRPRSSIRSAACSTRARARQWTARAYASSTPPPAQRPAWSATTARAASPPRS